HAVSANEQPEN
nr:immunoglobulin heavy chain junction region [Homo sapiens]